MARKDANKPLRATRPARAAASGTAGSAAAGWRRAFAFALRGCVFLICLTALLAGSGLWWLTERGLAAPPWLQARIEAQIARQTPQVDVRFGGMWLTLADGWRPVVELRDLRIANADAVPLLTVSDMRATLALRPLLERQVHPSRIAMSGLYATIRRQADGQIAVIPSGAPGGAALEAATLPDLINQVDALFLRPDLEALREIEVSTVTLRFEDARARRAWTIDGARFGLSREADALALTGDLALLSGGADVATMSANVTSRIGDAETRFGVSVAAVPARDIAAFNPAFGWLDSLRAPLSGSLRGGLDAAGALMPINATLQIAAGAFQPTGETRPIPFDAARAYFEFDPAKSLLRFDELSFSSELGRAVAEGSATLTGLDAGRLDELVGQLELTELEVNPPGMFDAPREMGPATIDFRLVPAPFRLDIGQVRIASGQGTDAGTLQFDGVLSAVPGGWDLALNGAMDRLTPARLLRFWPAEDVISRTRAWVARNVEGGVLHDVEFALRAAPDAPPETYLAFGFDDARLRYIRGLPPITGAYGRASLFQNRYAVSLEQGQVAPSEGGMIDVAGTRFVIPDTRRNADQPALAQLSLKTQSALTALLSLLDTPPLGVMAGAGLPVALAEAGAEMEADIIFPLGPRLQFQDLDIDLRGILQDLTSTALVPNRSLRAERLAVRVEQQDGDGSLQISGPGTFETIPFDALWHQEFGAQQSRLEAQIELSPNTVEVLSLGLPEGSVRGRGQGALTLDLPKDGPPRFTLRSDLVGVDLAIDPLGWRKIAGRPGALEVTGTLGALPNVDALRLEAPGLTAQGRISLRGNTEGAELDVAQFSRLRVGGWFDAPVILRGRGPGRAPEVVLRGGRVDIRGAPTRRSASGDAGPMQIALNELRLSDTLALTDLRGAFTVSRAGLQGTFSGSVNGRAPVTGNVVPQAGRSAFQIESADAGAVFAAAGLLTQARGGQMKLVLTPVGTGDAYNGALRVTETRVTGAPVIAELFNTISIVGALEQMRGSGLHFHEVDAAFRLTPQRVTLTEASAVGPSIGISLDGVYDTARGVLDMQGVFSPLYLLNGIGSVLTRRGEGLIGFNFAVSGPASDPRVQVNPVSALTPSIFREIFRRPPPEVAVEPGEEPGQAAPQILRAEPRATTQNKDQVAEDR